MQLFFFFSLYERVAICIKKTTNSTVDLMNTNWLKAAQVLPDTNLFTVRAAHAPTDFTLPRPSRVGFITESRVSVEEVDLNLQSQ